MRKEKGDFLCKPSAEASLLDYAEAQPKNTKCEALSKVAIKRVQKPKKIGPSYMLRDRLKGSIILLEFLLLKPSLQFFAIYL